MKRKIFIGGSAANPPTLGHRSVIEAVMWYGARNGGRKVIWIPSGIRHDKRMLPTALRRRMIHLTFSREWLGRQVMPVEIDWSDIDGENTPTINVFNWAFSTFPNDEIIWYTGADSITPRVEFDGKNEMQSKWYKGEMMHANPRYRFLIIPRVGYSNPSDVLLPNHFHWLDLDRPIVEVASSQIRTLVENNRSIPEGWLAPGVEELLRDFYRKQREEI